jgi:hypothetical protein
MKLEPMKREESMANPKPVKNDSSFFAWSDHTCFVEDSIADD